MAMNRKRLSNQKEFKHMNPIQQILVRWCPEGDKPRLARLCEVQLPTVESWFKGKNIPAVSALDGIAIVCQYNRKALGELQEPAVINGTIQGSRLNKDKFGTAFVYKVDTVQGVKTDEKENK